MGREDEHKGDKSGGKGRDPFPSLSRADSIEEIGTKIASYELLSVLGEGAFGIVYIAEQKRPIRRQVALKLIKPGMDSKQVIARFESERQALALLDHPNIARVYDGGATETGRPYFAMELVKGLPITEYCDKHKLSIEERLELFRQVCEAVQHAHQKGIVHRDIKPSNILVPIRGNKPVPVIIDFGVAKALGQPLTERTLFTEQGQFVGTPEYMSPEQAGITLEDVDTRSDIYSLGVLLYELLTGTLPFSRQELARAGFAEIQRIIREVDPPRPSTRLSSLGKEAREIAERRRTELWALTERVRKELEWIPLKAMRKEPDRRYKTASELADDVRNYLDGNPLIAGPESAIYRSRKFARKHAGLIGTVLGIVVALIIGFIVSAILRTEVSHLPSSDATRQVELKPEATTEGQEHIVRLTWTYKKPMLHGKGGAGAAAVGETIYTFAGHTEPWTPPFGRICEAYDTVTDTWTSIADLPHPDGRYNMSAISVSGKVYTFAGTNIMGGYNTRNVDEYDPSTNTWVANKATLPKNLSAVALAQYNGKIFCFGGGFYQSSDWWANDVYEYDPVTNTVTTKASMPTKRGCAYAATVGDKIYLIGGIGGYNANDALDLVERYDPGTDKWTTGYTPIPTPGDVGGGVIGERIYVNVFRTNELYEYNPGNDTWTPASPIRTVRSGQCIVETKSRLYVVGGWLSAGPMTPSVEEGMLPDTDPVAYWSFDDRDNLGRDSSGNGNDGSTVGGVTWTTGVRGGAVHLDGTGYVEIPDSPGLDLSRANGTLSAFIRVDESSKEFGIVSKESSSSFASNIAYEFNVVGSEVLDRFGLGMSNGISTNSVGYKGSSMKDSKWHHIAATWSGPGGEIVIYHDGVQVAKSEQTISMINDISEPVRIGAYRWNVGGVYRCMTGDIDEVRIYSYALTEEEIRTLVNSGAEHGEATQVIGRPYREKP